MYSSWYLVTAGRSHQYGWSGFNSTTFLGNNHISANTGRLAATWPQLTELEIDGFN